MLNIHDMVGQANEEVGGRKKRKEEYKVLLSLCFSSGLL